jgi:hypothetical protein
VTVKILSIHIDDSTKRFQKRGMPHHSQYSEIPAWDIIKIKSSVLREGSSDHEYSNH